MEKKLQLMFVVVCFFSKTSKTSNEQWVIFFHLRAHLERNIKKKEFCSKHMTTRIYDDGWRLRHGHMSFIVWKCHFILNWMCSISRERFGEWSQKKNISYWSRLSKQDVKTSSVEWKSLILYSFQLFFFITTKYSTLSALRALLPLLFSYFFHIFSLFLFNCHHFHSILVIRGNKDMKHTQKMCAPTNNNHNRDVEGV